MTNAYYKLLAKLSKNVEKLEEMEISNNNIVMLMQHKKTLQEGKYDF